MLEKMMSGKFNNGYDNAYVNSNSMFGFSCSNSDFSNGNYYFFTDSRGRFRS